ncbi:hypothetical protein AHF37_10938, partial [Paragonimus kellicotti]
MVIPIEEVVRTCTHIIQLGWAFYWGTCKWTAAEIMQAQSVARQFNLIPSALDQIEYNMLQRGRMPCIQEICAKLNRLQLDYVDIVIVSRQPDMVIPIEEVVRTCTHIIQLGWAFYWGTCKWTAAEIM